MFLPPWQTEETKPTHIFQFGGLDMREKPKAGSLSQGENLSFATYPALSPRAPRELVIAKEDIQAAVIPLYDEAPLTAFTGVKNCTFYYQGTPIGGATLMTGEKSIVDFNGKLCIFPDKLYYDYLPDGTTGQVATALSSMEKTLTLSGVKFYSQQNQVTGDYTAYLEKTNGGWSQFSVGDSLVISGCTMEQNNTHILSSNRDFASEEAIVSVVVNSVSENRLGVLLYNKAGALANFRNGTESKEITVKIHIPVMNYVCVHNNRLWGTDVNGQFIYASKLGDCLNFHAFQGLSSDSWYGQVASPGPFTGLVGYRNGVVAMKAHGIHHVYGECPTNFSIPKQISGGCTDGKSLVELGGVLYYLSQNGFYAYTGGEPYYISHPLPQKYKSCTAGTDGKYYYASAQRESGLWDVLVYDPERNLWQREDSTCFFSFLQDTSGLYGVSKEGIVAFGKGTEEVSWSATSPRLTYDSMLYQGAYEIRILADCKEKAHLAVSIAYDDGVFCQQAVPDTEIGLKSYRVPVQFRFCDSFRIRVEGKGKVVLHGVEISAYRGGKTYGK